MRTLVMNGLLTAAAMLTVGVHPVSAASEDAARLDPLHAMYARYIRLDDVPKEYRVTLIKLLLVKINDVSQSTDIYPPWIVPSSDLSLVRINTTDYGETFAKVYEKLASPWDSQVVDDATYEPEYGTFGLYQGDRLIRTFSKEIGKKLVGKNRRTIPAFWLTDSPELQKQFNALVKRTQTNVPIIRAAWLINRISAQQNRSPTGYNDFLGVDTEADFQRLGDFDAKKKLLRVEWRAAVGFSGVTTQPRALRRDGAPDSPYWRSFDFKLAVNERDPLQIFGQDIEDAFRAAGVDEVASEQYILLPNGLWATGAFNNKGKAQEVAPNFVAGNHRSSSNDFQIHVGVSCQVCHSNGGLHDINNWAKSYFPPPLELGKKTLEEARLFREQYGRDLGRRIERDRLEYTDVVKRWTGWTTKELADAVAYEWNRYENMRVDRKQLAALLNTTEAKLFSAIDATVKAGNADRILSNIVIRNEPAPIRSVEGRVPVAHLALRGLQPPP